jgi:hypothetical protein
VGIQELGSLGELIAAIATIGTVAYFAVQVRQSTRALKSSTFQAISNDMSVSSEAVSTNSELASVINRATAGLADLSATERSQYHFFLLMTFRRLESVYVQRELGFIAPELTRGFEQSVISAISNGGGAEWWSNAKPAFSEQFVAYVDKRLATESFPGIHPGFDFSENSEGQSS